MDQAETHFTKTSDGLRIAYQVVGDGQVDLLLEPGSQLGPVDLAWEEPTASRALARLASFSRLIMWDNRGTGASDSCTPTLEGWLEDMVTVLNAVGSTRAAVMGVGDGSLDSIMFAASYPDRTTSLVLVNSYARILRDQDYPYGVPAHILDASVEHAASSWGTGVDAAASPSRQDDERFQQWLARSQRLLVPANIVADFRNDMLRRDVRHILPAVRVPTLVVHRIENPFIGVGHGRYLSEHVPNARYVELAGSDHHFFAGDQDALLDEVQQFLTGKRPTLDADRALATILFTDIVSSTEHSSRLGDRRWRSLLDAHDAVIATELDRYRGTKVHSIGLGDGVLATFDGPARAVRCAQAICSAVRPLGVEVRAGLHTGEIERRGVDVSGIAVHIGQRISALAESGEVLVSRTVTDLVAGSGLTFEMRGEYELKGLPGKWTTYRVTS